MSFINVYTDINDVAKQIYQNDSFNELINYLAENNNYKFIEQSNEELTLEGKQFIKNLAKELDDLEKLGK